MPFLILIGIGLWFWLGDPPKTLANWFWENDAAPWESVDAYFYPSRSDLSAHKLAAGLSTVEACRLWASSQAAAIGDARFARSDYECGVGKLDSWGGMTVYRITAR